MPHDEVAGRLLVALERRDETVLTAILHPAVRIVVDTGDARGGEWRGRARVVRVLEALLWKRADGSGPGPGPAAPSLALAQVNGNAGIVLRSSGERGGRGGTGEVVGVLALALAPGGSIGDLWLSAAPGKLAHWNRGGSPSA